MASNHIETYLRDGYSTMDDIRRTIRYQSLHADNPPGVLPISDWGRRLPSQIMAGSMLHGILGVVTETS